MAMILIVDDEPALKGQLLDLLRAEGLTVQALDPEMEVWRASRAAPPHSPDVLVAGGLRLDVPNLSVTLPDDQVVQLTPVEMRILRRLMAEPNKVISREELRPYATDDGADSSANQLDVYIGRVRRKLGDNPRNPRYIQTVKGRGYRFLAAGES